jgi:GNAT superfamily N-acetyltransferase
MPEQGLSGEINCRAGNEADAGAIAEVIGRIVQESNPVGFDHAWTADEVRNWLRRHGANGGIFVAETADQIAGFAALDFNTEQPDTGTLGVWVLPQWRRKGLGTELAECALQFAREAGYRRIRGRLPRDNEPALSFLSQIGAMAPLVNPEMRFELPLQGGG